MRSRRSWPPERAPLRRGERLLAGAGLVLVALLYLARLDAGSRLLPEDDEQCTKWPPVRTEQCHELVPLDEVHYVPDARDVVRFGTESDVRVPTDDDGAFVVHPPVGKWFIALGIALLGDEPTGWRLFNALAGIVGVALTFSFARRLLGGFRWPLAAAGIVALDGLWFTMSRLAMLDIATAMLTLAAVRATIEVLARSVESRPRTAMRIAAGALWGLALASKWSIGSYAVAAVLLLLAAEAVAGRKRQRSGADRDEPVEVEVFGRDAIEAWANALVSRSDQERPRTGRALAATLVSMTLIPVVVYTATFAPWFADGDRYLPPRCEAHEPLAAAWLCYQREQLDFHRNLEKYEAAEPDEDEGSASETTLTTPGTDETPVVVVSSKPAHPYFGHAISWAWLGRPVVHAYFTETADDGVERASEVMSVPNPISWWFGFAAAIPWLVVAARRERSARILLALIAAGWVPYLLADLVARPVYLFYATPLVPFLATGTAMLMRRLWDGPGDGTSSPFARGLVAGVLVAAAGAFAWLYPIHAALPLPLDDLGWSARIWFSTDCAVENSIKVLCWI